MTAGPTKLFEKKVQVSATELEDFSVWIRPDGTVVVSAGVILLNARSSMGNVGGSWGLSAAELLEHGVSGDAPHVYVQWWNERLSDFERDEVRHAVRSTMG